VTRFAEFSHIRQMFASGSVWKINEAAQVFAYFLTCKINVLIWTKLGLGHILGDYFTSSSGHPEKGTVCTWVNKVDRGSSSLTYFCFCNTYTTFQRYINNYLGITTN
jgi:hypothetical protein